MTCSCKTHLLEALDCDPKEHEVVCELSARKEHKGVEASWIVEEQATELGEASE